ncbi:MAG: EF-hand domain-containing protein [Halofilum sp. (in: g-proteobacteria)]|nr:EF-hand domain-containing protein [Halofilum sp. (in: g-proteobacteria)]
MKAAAISTILGLTLISGALLAETIGLDGRDGRAAAERFDAYDADGDGRVSRDEAGRMSAGLHTHFAKFDRDADGTLSRAEFRRHAAPDAADG